MHDKAPFMAPATRAGRAASASPVGRQALLWSVPLALALWVASVPAAEVFRWTDAQGRTHYGSQPPPGVQAQPVRSAAPLPPDAAERAQKERQHLLERADSLDEARRAAQDRQAEQAQRDAQARRQRCALARSELRLYDAERPVFTRDRQGQRVYEDDATRDANAARLRAEVATHCGAGDAARDPGVGQGSQAAAARRRCNLAREALRDLQAVGARVSAAELQQAGDRVRAACGG
jgi:Domain of unknown function (DUF4124)